MGGAASLLDPQWSQRSSVCARGEVGLRSQLCGASGPRAVCRIHREPWWEKWASTKCPS